MNFFVFQGLASDKDGLVKLKNSVKEISKTGNSEYPNFFVGQHFKSPNIKLSCQSSIKSIMQVVCSAFSFKYL